MKVSLKVMLSLVGRFGALSNDELSLGLLRARLIACVDRISTARAAVPGFIPKKGMTSARRCSKF